MLSGRYSGKATDEQIDPTYAHLSAENTEHRVELTNAAYISRGFAHGEWAVPARDVDVRTGRGLLRKASASWPGWLAVTSPHAFKNAQSFLATKPRAIANVASLDFNELTALADGMTAGAELVVGLGAGRDLDAAKHVALKKDLPLVLVPTATSCDAFVHGYYPKLNGRALNGQRTDWPYCDPDHVILDFDLVLKAPRHLNTAGTGEVLSCYTAITEWRYAARRGIGPLDYERVVMPVLRYQHRLANEFPSTLDASGELTPASITLIADALQQRDDRKLNHPAATASEHDFASALNLVSPRHHLHGEVVCLASLIVTWCTNEYEHHRQRIDACKVRRRPSEIGIDKEELRRALAFVPEYFADRKIDSVLRREPVIGERFDALWEWVETR